MNDLRSQARKQYTYFKYGTNTPAETMFAKLGETVKEGYQWVLDKIGSGSDAARKEAMQKADKLRQEL